MSTVKTTSVSSAGRSWRTKCIHHVTPSAVTTMSINLMPMNGAMSPPSAVDQQVALEHLGSGLGTELHPAERQWNQGHDDQGVEDDRREDRRAGRSQLHDVDLLERREHADEHGGDDGEVLRHVVRDRERRQGAAGDQQLLADLDDLDELRRVGVQVHHVPGLLGGLGPGVHRHPDVGLGERRRVVGAVAGHGDQVAAGLLGLDERHLVLGRRFGQEAVDPGLLGDRRCSEGVVAGDHHGPDAHRTKLVEALAHPRA